MLLAYGMAWQGVPLPDRLGLLGHPLAWVMVDDLAVLVEPGFEEPALAGWGESRWLEAALTHAAVVQTVFATATILPIALRSGFFADVTPLYRLLQEQGAHWRSRLQVLAGCGEATVRATSVPLSRPTEGLTGRAYFAAKREQGQGLAAVQAVLRAHCRDYRVRPVQAKEALCWDVLMTPAQLADLQIQTTNLPGWQVQIGEWLPPYSFV